VSETGLEVPGFPGTCSPGVNPHFSFIFCLRESIHRYFYGLNPENIISMKRILPSLILAVLLLPMLALTGCKGGNSKGKETGPAKKAVVADAVVVCPGVLEHRIFASGSLIASEEVELHSEGSGRVTDILFTEGSMVKAGDLLVKMDDRELQSQLRKLRLEESLLEQDVLRKEKLLQIKAISKEEYDISKNQLDVLKANIELTLTQISKTEIRAPFSGRIGLRAVSRGGYITPALSISTLMQVDPLKLEFTIPEKYAGKLSPGSVIRFTTEGNEQPYQGKVYARDTRIDPLTRTLKIRALCPNPGNQLLPGAFARIDVLIGKQDDALTIPTEAIIPVIDGEKVMVIEQGKARSKKIESGIRTRNQVEVISGLQAGDTVLVSGLMMVKEEMAVKPRVVRDTIVSR